MKLRYLIDNLISPDIQLLDFVDRYAGIVKTINMEFNGDKKRFPVACNVTEKDCNNTSSLQNLVPDDSKMSVIYWEELDPMKIVGYTPTKTFNNRKLQGTARIVVWLNLAKMGQTSCTSPIEVQLELEKAITKNVKITSGVFENSKLTILPARSVPNDINVVFGKYDYKKTKNYYLYPFDFFAIDVVFTLEQCLTKGASFVLNPSIDCVNGGTSPDACELLLGRLTDAQKLECILPSYDFSDDNVWNNTTPTQQADMSDRLCADSFTNEYAMQFSGSNYINGGNYAAIDFDHTDAFTLSCRIIADDWGQTRMIMGKRNVLGIGYNLFSQAGKLRIVFRGGITSNAIIIDSSANMVNGQAYHILVSYTGSGLATGVSVYVDGSLLATNPIQGSVTSTLSNTSNYNTGASNGLLNMVGIIDCERVWDFALSAADALSEWNGGTPKAPLYPNNLVLWDKMGDDATFDGSVWRLPNPSLVSGSVSVGMNLASRIATPFV